MEEDIDVTSHTEVILFHLLVLSLVLRHLISFQCLGSQNLTPLEQHAKPALLVNKIEVGAV